MTRMLKAAFPRVQRPMLSRSVAASTVAPTQHAGLMARAPRASTQTGPRSVPQASAPCSCGGCSGGRGSAAKSGSSAPCSCGGCGSNRKGGSSSSARTAQVLQRTPAGGRNALAQRRPRAGTAMSAFSAQPIAAARHRALASTIVPRGPTVVPTIPRAPLVRRAIAGPRTMSPRGNLFTGLGDIRTLQDDPCPTSTLWACELACSGPNQELEGTPAFTKCHECCDAAHAYCLNGGDGCQGGGTDADPGCCIFQSGPDADTTANANCYHPGGGPNPCVEPPEEEGEEPEEPEVPPYFGATPYRGASAFVPGPKVPNMSFPEPPQLPPEEECPKMSGRLLNQWLGWCVDEHGGNEKQRTCCRTAAFRQALLCNAACFAGRPFSPECIFLAPGCLGYFPSPVPQPPDEWPV